LFAGPYAADIFNPRAWGDSSNPEEPIDVITIEFTRIVLAIGVFAIGVELPKAYMLKHWKSLFFLLVPGMIWVRPLCSSPLLLILICVATRVGSYAQDSYTL
jgi:NhaP-type Na+/H+ or K+/H+ antiporter